jgi:hypothetical protein
LKQNLSLDKLSSVKREKIIMSEKKLTVQEMIEQKKKLDEMSANLNNALNVERNALTDKVRENATVKKFADTCKELDYSMTVELDNDMFVRIYHKTAKVAKVKSDSDTSSTREASKISVRNLDTNELHENMTREELCKLYDYKHFKSFKTKASDNDKNKMKFEIITD